MFIETEVVFLNELMEPDDDLSSEILMYKLHESDLQIVSYL